MKRDPGGRLAPSQRLALSAKIRACLAAHPDATIAEVRAVTGASDNLIMKVRERLRYELERARMVSPECYAPEP